jgi:hypothetical protein
MKNINQIFIPFYPLLLSVIGLSSCIESVDLPIRIEKPKLVVEGVLSDEKAPCTIRLTNTSTFAYANQTFQSQAVNGALVQIIDSTDNKIYTLPQVYEEAGVYRTRELDFAGKIGHVYVLSVKTPEGEEYLSKAEKLQKVPPIDNLYVEYTETAKFEQPYGHLIYIDLKDPKNVENFYRWEVYFWTRRRSTGVVDFFSGQITKDFCWQYFRKTAFDVESDRDIDGNQIQKKNIWYAPIYNRGSHLIEVSQYAISREAYVYYQRLNDQYNRTGTIFDPIPSTIEGNVYDKKDPTKLTLGYFSVAGVIRKRLVVPLTDEVYLSKISAITLPFRGEGDCVSFFPFSIAFRPSDW